MFAMMTRQGLAQASKTAGLDLSAQEIEGLAQAEKAFLGEAGRICFGDGASVKLIQEFSNSPYLGNDVADALASLIEAFYDIREDMPAQVTDQEVLEELHSSFDGEAAGDAGLASSHTRRALSSSDSLRAYAIADDDGRIYRWDPDEWADDVTADGWHGEHWGDDYE